MSQLCYGSMQIYAFTFLSRQFFLGGGYPAVPKSTEIPNHGCAALMGSEEKKNVD